MHDTVFTSSIVINYVKMVKMHKQSNIVNQYKKNLVDFLAGSCCPVADYFDIHKSLLKHNLNKDLFTFTLTLFWKVTLKTDARGISLC